MARYPGPLETDEDIERAIDWKTTEKLLGSVEPPVCEYRRDRRDPSTACGAPASWMLIMSCGHDAYLCEPHHERVEARYLKAGHRVTECKIDGPISVRWVKL